MTDLNDIDARVLEILTRPSIETLIQFFSERTYVHTIHWSDWLKEEKRLEQFMAQSGYEDWDHIQFHVPAMNILEGRVWERLEEHGLRPCGSSASAESQIGNLEITFVFNTELDAVYCKLALG